MPYAFTLDIPSNEEIYVQIQAKVRANYLDQTPAGMIAHIVYKTDAGLRHVEVWESKEAWDEFATVLGPIIGEVLAGRGIESGPPHEQVAIDVIDAWVAA